MSVEQQVDRVVSGAKNALKLLIQKLGGTVPDDTAIDGYADIISAMSLDKMTPKAHKDTHKTGGSDALMPGDIGAAEASHTHDYLPLTGGTLTGNLTGRYITGTWLQSTAATDKTGNFATIDGDGWIYYRTPAEVVTDLDLPNNTSIRASTSVYGITRLSNSTTSSSKTLAATPYAVKTALAQTQAKAQTLTLSLAVADWTATSKTQTCVATGVTADNIVIVSPAPASQEAYSAAGVKCTAQGTDSLTFTCESIPTEALSVNVVIL